MARSIKRCIARRWRRAGPIACVLILLLVGCPSAVVAQADAIVASVEETVEDYPAAPGRTDGFTTMVHRKFLVLSDGTRVRVKGVTVLRTGQTVVFKKEKLHGKAPQKEPALTEATIDSTDLTPVSQAPTSSMVIEPWTLLVINTPSHPAGWVSPSAAQTMMANFDTFLRAGSYGAFGIVATIYQATIAEPDPSYCGYSGITDAGLAALKSQGITVTPYTYIHTVFPGMDVCGWGGLAYVGGAKSWGRGTWTIDHEGGHNLGQGHSGFIRRNGTALSIDQYGDGYDPMGQCCDGQRQHYNAGQKVQILHWLTSQIVTASGTYTLVPYEAPSGLRALEFLPAPGSGNTAAHFYVESRGNYNGDVLIHAAQSLWDVDPGPSDVRALAPGASTVLPTGETLTTLSSGTTGAVIQVVFPGDPGGFVAPTALAWTPSGGSVPVPTAPTAVSWSPQ